MGVPIISYDITAILELIVHEKEGYIVDKYDTNIFADYMNKIIESNIIRKEISNNCIMKAKDFDIKSIIKKWRNILNYE